MPAATRAWNLSESLFARVCPEGGSAPPPVMTHSLTRRSVLQMILATSAAALPFRLSRLPETVARPSRTKLDEFLRAHSIKPALLARVSGYSRQHLLRLRLGRTEPTPRCVVHLTAAVRRITGDDVKPRDLFDISPRSIR